MQDHGLSCQETRRMLAGEWPAGVTDHLARCESCLEAALGTALQEPVKTPVPPGFGARTLRRAAQLGEERSALPYFLFAAGVVFVGWAAAAVTSGALGRLAEALGGVRFEVLLGVMAGEALVLLLWLWRAVCSSS